jgi:5-methylcytosine-specific restriction endonuclease McrA
VVDHITPHRGDKALLWDRFNWQPLCEGCHNGAKQREERHL